MAAYFQLNRCVSHLIIRWCIKGFDKIMEAIKYEVLVM